MTCRHFTDDALLDKLRGCFLDAPTMNEAREELRNMRQKENESITIYTYRWGWALLRSSGICPEDERHPNIIKDFITSLKRNIRNKIANRWTEMRNPTRMVQDAFKLADNMESQLQVADSFKMELSNNFPSMEVNEMSVDKTSGNEFEVNKMSRGKKWGNNKNNNYKCSSYNTYRNFNSRPQYNKPQENRTDKTWGQKGKDSKITLTQESAHYIPTEFSNSFFKQFDLAMKTRKEELKKQGKTITQVNEITEGDMIPTFGVTEDQMQKAAEILGKDKNSKKSGNSSL